MKRGKVVKRGSVAKRGSTVKSGKAVRDLRSVLTPSFMERANEALKEALKPEGDIQPLLPILREGKAAWENAFLGFQERTPKKEAKEKKKPPKGKA